MRIVLSLIGALLLAGQSAWADQASSTGTFTPGHALRANTGSGTPYSDAGGAAGSSKLGSGYLTELGITNTGTPFCINDALVNAPGGYHRFCLGHDTDGNATLYASKGMIVTIGESNYSFPSSGNGNVNGPNSPFAQSGYVTVWNGGLNVKDAYSTNTNAITLASAAARVQANGTQTPSSISLYAGSAGNDYSGLSSTLTVTGGTTMGQINGFGSYVYNTVASNGFVGNGIAYYGICAAAVNGAYCWGMNPVLVDGATSESGTGGARLIQNEFDFNIHHTDTIANGIAITGASTATTPSSTAIFVDGTDGAAHPGAPVHPWTLGLDFSTGSVTSAIVINPTAPGNSVSDPPVIWNFYDSGGTLRNYAMTGTPTAFNFTSLLAAPVWNFSGTVQAGTLIAGIGGLSSVNGAFSGAITVGAPLEATGSIDAVTYYVNGTAGVTCTGAPTSSFATVAGIVTHC